MLSLLPSGPCLCPTSGERVNNPSFLSGACRLEGIYSLLLAGLRHLFSLVKFSSLCLLPLTYLLIPVGFLCCLCSLLCLFHCFFYLLIRNSLNRVSLKPLYNFLLHTPTSLAVLFLPTVHFLLTTSIFIFSQSSPLTGRGKGMADLQTEPIAMTSQSGLTEAIFILKSS